MENNKISMRQIYIIFYIAVASPMIRIIPKYSSEIAKQASWVTPIFSSILYLLLLMLLNKLICKSKRENESLEDVFNRVLGNFIGKTLTYIYIVWMIILIALYLRYFADRLTVSIFVSTPNRFFITTMLFLVFIVVRRDIKFFARFIEIFYIVFFTFVVGSFFISIPDIKITNLLPVTLGDMKNVLISIYPFIGILGYMTFMFFLGDYIKDKENIKKYWIKDTLYHWISGTNIIILTVGIFGPELTQYLNLPFFNFYKIIEILGIIERIESILIAFWIVVDFCIITIFTYIVLKLIKKNLNLSSSKQIVTPILFLVYILSLFISSNIFEINNFSKYIGLPINILLTFIVPIIILIVGKIRKKI